MPNKLGWRNEHNNCSWWYVFAFNVNFGDLGEYLTFEGIFLNPLESS